MTNFLLLYRYISLIIFGGVWIVLMRFLKNNMLCHLEEAKRLRDPHGFNNSNQI